MTVSFTLALVPSLMVMGLLAPFVGPAIDHHYADRSPVHAHALVGDATNQHDHALALNAHEHLPGDTGDGVSVATGSATSPHSPLTLDGATFKSLSPIFDDHVVAVYAVDLHLPDAEAIAPLDRPPRSA